MFEQDLIFTVLVVEDDPVLNKRIILSLQKSQWNMVGVHSAGEALAWLDEQSADLLLIDYRLPDLTVEDLMARLQSNIAFIIMTAYADVRIAVEMMKMGAMDFLIKDTDFFHMLPAVLGKAIKQLAMEKSLQHYQDELKASEQLARQQEKKARKVFDSVTEGIIVLSNSGNVIMVNPYFSVITAFSELDIKGENYRKLLPIDSCTSSLDEMKNALQQYGLWEGEILALRKNAVVFPAYIEISAITDLESSSIQYIVLLRDISQQKRLEEERERLQEQKERVNRLASLSAMSAGLIHEIAQPLNGLKVIADCSLLLMEMGRNPSQEKVKDSFLAVARQVDHIENIIKNMRSFASTGTEISDTPVDVNLAIQDVINMMRQQLNDREIGIEEDLCSELVWLSVSKQSLEQVMVNLLLNAIHAFDRSTRTHKLLRISTIPRANELSIIVADNAIGIDVNSMHKIFDPFFTTKLAGDGSGLGLTIINSIITNMNGRIEVMNNEQGGASFIISLPIFIAKAK